MCDFNILAPVIEPQLEKILKERPNLEPAIESFMMAVSMHRNAQGSRVLVKIDPNDAIREIYNLYCKYTNESN